MANVKLDRPSPEDLGGLSKTMEYFEKLISELEYILENLDEENMTERYNRLHKENSDGK